jgi:hypothetical protein
MKGILIMALAVLGVAIGIVYYALGAEDRACRFNGGHLTVNKEPTTYCYPTKPNVCVPSFNVTTTCVGARE